MADLNAELLRALDGPGPQHKKHGEQAFEFTEGEQGKLFTGNHVMTDSGLWVPQKGTNDGAAHTQLTGRIVELYSEDNFQVSAGAIIDFANPNSISGEIVKDFKEITLGVNAENEHNFNIQIQFFGDGYRHPFHYSEKIAESEGRDRLLTDVLRLKTPYIRIRFQNQSQNDQIYNYVKLFGVR